MEEDECAPGSLYGQDVLESDDEEEDEEDVCVVRGDDTTTDGEAREQEEVAAVKLAVGALCEDEGEEEEERAPHPTAVEDLPDEEIRLSISVSSNFRRLSRAPTLSAPKQDVPQEGTCDHECEEGAVVTIVEAEGGRGEGRRSATAEPATVTVPVVSPKKSAITRRMDVKNTWRRSTTLPASKKVNPRIAQPPHRVRKAAVTHSGAASESTWSPASLGRRQGRAGHSEVRLSVHTTPAFMHKLRYVESIKEKEVADLKAHLSIEMRYRQNLCIIRRYCAGLQRREDLLQHSGAKESIRSLGLFLNSAFSVNMKYISHIRAVIAESDTVEFLQLGALFIDLLPSLEVYRGFFGLSSHTFESFYSLLSNSKLYAVLRSDDLSMRRRLLPAEALRLPLKHLTSVITLLQQLVAILQRKRSKTMVAKMGDMYDEDFIPTHPDIETRMEAVELYSKLATQLSEAASRLDKVLVKCEILERISSLPADLVAPLSRSELVRHGLVTKQVKGKTNTAQSRYLFLFTRVLIYCSVPSNSKRARPSSGSASSANGEDRDDEDDVSRFFHDQIAGVYQCKGVVYCSDMLVTFNRDRESVFEFSRADKKKTYVITSRSYEDKKLWMDALSAVANRSAASTDERSSQVGLNKGEMFAAGVLQIKQSAEMDYEALAAIVFNDEYGVPVGEKMILLRKYTKCFSGAAIVQWMEQREQALEFDHQKCVVLSAELLAREYIDHINPSLKEGPTFQDRTNYLYRRSDGTRCLNGDSIFMGEARGALEVSIELLNRLIGIFHDQRDLLARFGEDALDILRVDPHYVEFVYATAELQQVQLDGMPETARAAFFVNVYNTMLLHGVVERGAGFTNAHSYLKRIPMLRKTCYNIGGDRYSLLFLEFGLMRNPLEPPDTPLSAKLMVHLDTSDRRARHGLTTPFPLIPFALYSCTRSSPPLAVFDESTFEEQLAANARSFFRNTVRVFSHSNKKKVVLPKLAGWYWRDLGATKREMVQRVRQLMTEKRTTELSYLDESLVESHELVISFDDFDFSFDHPSKEQDMESEQDRLRPDLLVKNYVFPLPAHQTHPLIYVQEQLAESKFAFVVPHKLLQILIRLREYEYSAVRERAKFENKIVQRLGGMTSEALSQVGNIDDMEPVFTAIRDAKSRLLWSSYLLRAREAQLAQLIRNANVYEDYRADYQGLTFRPSTYKKDSTLACIPINLHVQLMRVSYRSSFQEAHVFDHVTFGAPAAHLYKFKCGLRQLFESIHKLKSAAVIGKPPPMLFEQRPLRAAATSLVQPGVPFPCNEAPFVFAHLDQHKRMEEAQLSAVERLDVCLPQAAAALVTSFVQKLELNVGNQFFLAQITKIGFLVHFESLLSTHGAEMGMLGDMEYSVRCLSTFAFSLVPNDDGVVDVGVEIYLARGDRSVDQSMVFPSKILNEDDVGLEDVAFIIELRIPKSWTERLPAPLLERGYLITVWPVLFTQGINENQTVAIKLGECKLQEEINQEAIVYLTTYFERFSSFVATKSTGISYNLVSLKGELEQIRQIVMKSKNEKNTKILPLTADFTRKLNAGRLTSCKSAKDRTSMSITWEQARIIQATFGISNNLVPKVTKEMRTSGVRRENAFKNIGKQKFAFNKLQRHLLPGVYRAPKGTGGASTS